MKKVKKLYCFILTTILIVCLCIIPVSAASVDMPSGSYVANEVLDFSMLASENGTYHYNFTITHDGIVYRCVYIALMYDSSTWNLVIGGYDPDMNSSDAPVALLFYNSAEGWATGFPVTIDFNESFEITDDDFYEFFTRNFTLIENKFNLFTTCYNLIVEYVFAGEGVENGILVDPAQHLTVTILSTIAWIFVVVIPFIVAWWFIKVVCTAFGRF